MSNAEGIEKHMQWVVSEVTAAGSSPHSGNLAVVSREMRSPPPLATTMTTLAQRPRDLRCGEEPQRSHGRDLCG